MLKKLICFFVGHYWVTDDKFACYTLVSKEQLKPVMILKCKTCGKEDNAAN